MKFRCHIDRTLLLLRNKFIFENEVSVIIYTDCVDTKLLYLDKH